MGVQVILQPDGNLAVFSSSVRRWLSWDLTSEDAACWLADHRQFLDWQARNTVDAVRSRNADAVYGRDALTFEEANALSVNGAEIFASLGDVELRRVLDGTDG